MSGRDRDTWAPHRMRGGGPTLDPAPTSCPAPLPTTKSGAPLSQSQRIALLEPACSCRPHPVMGAGRLSPAVRSEVTLNAARGGPLGQPGLSNDPMNTPFPEHRPTTWLRQDFLQSESHGDRCRGGTGRHPTNTTSRAPTRGGEGDGHFNTVSGRQNKAMGSGAEESWVQIPAPPLTGCVTSGEFLNLSEPQLLHLKNRRKKAQR